jgi:hypothetical protein
MKNAKMEEAQKQLLEGVQSFKDSGTFKRYLDVMSKFHSYSFYNTMLIFMQRPEAQQVAGYKAWQEKFGRHVKQGGKAIWILAPRNYKKQKTVTVKDAAGNDVQETYEAVWTNFVTVPVYDVSDTEGKELPSIGVHELTAQVKDYNKILAVLKSASPVSVSFEHVEGGAHGYYSPLENRIVVDEGMSEAQTIKTLSHEIAHALLNEQDEKNKVSREAREVEAESVAYIVTKEFGIDSSDYSFGYVSTWANSGNIKEVRSYMENIRKTATSILDKIEKGR